MLIILILSIFAIFVIAFYSVFFYALYLKITGQEDKWDDKK